MGSDVIGGEHIDDGVNMGIGSKKGAVFGQHVNATIFDIVRSQVRVTIPFEI